jgi:hypothetical protein
VFYLQERLLTSRVRIDNALRGVIRNRIAYIPKKPSLRVLPQSDLPCKQSGIYAWLKNHEQIYSG